MKCEVEPNRLTSHFLAVLYNSGEDMAWENWYKIGYIGVPIEQVNYLAGHKSMTKRYDHANEERYGAAFEALDAVGKTGNAEALAAARWKQR